MRIFIFVFILISQLSFGQKNEFHYTIYPLFLGIHGKADSIVIKRYSVVPKKFGDTLYIKNLSYYTVFVFDVKGWVNKIKKFGKNNKIWEDCTYDIINNRLQKITIINHQETGYNKTVSLINTNGNTELWAGKYKNGIGNVLDTIKIEYTGDGMIEEKHKISGNKIKTTSVFNNSGFLISQKVISETKNITLRTWKYNKNLLISELAGSLLSGLGAMTSSVFFFKQNR